MPYELMRRFESYAWPGNVRELHNAVARQIALGSLAQLETAVPLSTREAPRALALAPSLPIAPEPLRDTFDPILAEAFELPFTQARQRVMEEFERRYVERVLDKHGGSVVRAAAGSGIARRYFQIVRARSAK